MLQKSVSNYVQEFQIEFFYEEQVYEYLSSIIVFLMKIKVKSIKNPHALLLMRVDFDYSAWSDVEVSVLVTSCAPVTIILPSLSNAATN